MAKSLVASMAGDFDPSEYTDEYRAALQSVIDAKVEGREVVEAAAPATSGGGEVVDLMAALRASVDAAKNARSAPAPAPARPRPARSARPATKAAKLPAAKAAAKKAARPAGRRR